MAGYTMQTTVDFSGDRDAIKRTSAAFRNSRELMERVGLLGLLSASRRVQAQVAQSEGTSTGRLQASLAKGGKDNLFAASDHQVDVGSNLRYAAQRHFGGTIYPASGDALAIPVNPYLKRHGIWPSELDPSRSILQFRPTKQSGKANIFGVLINPEDEGSRDRGSKGSRKRRTGKAKAPGGSSLPKGVLYVLAYLVRQEAKPFLYWSSEDAAVIDREIVPAWLARR